ncbi:hypothetical protein NRA36_14520, partial [Acinetobacter baumannii]|nr:hypothetical protein [Acinetobacter baumannii]
YYKNNYYNNRRDLSGLAYFKLRKLIYYDTQDITLIIIEENRRSFYINVNNNTFRNIYYLS